MNGKEAEELLMSIDESFGFTSHDFEDGKLIYNQWGDDDNYIDVADLKHRSLKISKNLGDIYIDKIRTDEWVIVGKGTTLHCDDIEAGKGIVLDFEGFLM